VIIPHRCSLQATASEFAGDDDQLRHGPVALIALTTKTAPQ